MFKKLKYLFCFALGILFIMIGTLMMIIGGVSFIYIDNSADAFILFILFAGTGFLITSCSVEEIKDMIEKHEIQKNIESINNKNSIELLKREIEKNFNELYTKLNKLERIDRMTFSEVIEKRFEDTCEKLMNVDIEKIKNLGRNNLSRIEMCLLRIDSFITEINNVTGD